MELVAGALESSWPAGSDISGGLDKEVNLAALGPYSRFNWIRELFF